MPEKEVFSAYKSKFATCNEYLYPYKSILQDVYLQKIGIVITNVRLLTYVAKKVNFER